MGDTKIAHNIYCAWCNGTGYFLDDNQKKNRCVCNKKWRAVYFTRSDKACEYCEDGKIIEDDSTKQFTLRIGLMRKIKVSESRCPFCFGTGKQHFMWMRTPCEKCKATGKITEYHWQTLKQLRKKLFKRQPWEVLKGVEKPCPACEGAKCTIAPDKTLYDGSGFYMYYNLLEGSDFVTDVKS